MGAESIFIASISCILHVFFIFFLSFIFHWHSNLLFILTFNTITTLITGLSIIMNAKLIIEKCFCFPFLTSLGCRGPFDLFIVAKNNNDDATQQPPSHMRCWTEVSEVELFQRWYGQHWFEHLRTTSIQNRFTLVKCDRRVINVTISYSFFFALSTCQFTIITSEREI